MHPLVNTDRSPNCLWLWNPLRGIGIHDLPDRSVEAYDLMSQNAIVFMSPELIR